MTTWKKVLNVGGGDKLVPIPPTYSGWEHLILDIDPRGKPDIVCDAREMMSLQAAEFDAVYCSHNLEHYYRHDVPRVLLGFAHVLKHDGFIDIRVPDMGQLFQKVVEGNLDIDDILYESPAGPIMVSDVIYGYHVELEQTGNDFYAHKTGFTVKSLQTALLGAGFTHVITAVQRLEIKAYAFHSQPSDATCSLLRI